MRGRQQPASAGGASASWQPPEPSGLLSPDAALAEIIEQVTRWTSRLQFAEEATALLIFATIAFLALQLLLRGGRGNGVSGANGKPASDVAARAALELATLDAGGGGGGGAHVPPDALHGTATAPAAGAGRVSGSTGLDADLADVFAAGPPGGRAPLPIREEEDGDAEGGKERARPAAPPSAGAPPSLPHGGASSSSSVAPRAHRTIASNGGTNAAVPSALARANSGGKLSRSALHAHSAAHTTADGGDGARRRIVDRRESAAPSEMSTGSRLSRATYKSALSSIAVREGMRRRPNDPFDQAVLRTMMLGSPEKAPGPVRSAALTSPRPTGAAAGFGERLLASG
ncbi:hypothetical protein KFE25_011760 [Diacronema lutheri]|uniref:Uncharacterized protein n=2 Tax=Diacronema lutheri TaxID=2081491 RepID=A0A8J6C4J5_DIALT|nr:hypothetical protein KFE25_011760 [Diacronema lutheri]